MARQTDYIFTEPTQDHGYLAQLQEWANHYHVTLAWNDHTSQQNGISSTTSYPIIKGHPYPEFSGVGPKMRLAQGMAAENIIRSRGTLNMARSRQPPTVATIYPVAR